MSIKYKWYLLKRKWTPRIVYLLSFFKAKEIWFLENISPFDMEEKSSDVYLSNYNLLSHEEIEKKEGKKISKLRWVTLQGAELKAGGAKGLFRGDGGTFELSYAWGGLNSPEDYHIRQSYTVRIRGKGCEKYFRNLGQQIAKVEGEKPCMGTQMNQATSYDPVWSPFLHKVRPYKERKKNA